MIHVRHEVLPNTLIPMLIVFMWRMLSLNCVYVVAIEHWRIKRKALQWGQNGHDDVSNHQPHGCLLNRLFRRRSKETSKLRVTGLCEGNSPVTGEFPAQRASNAENVSIWWRHHVVRVMGQREKSPLHQWCIHPSTQLYYQGIDLPYDSFPCVFSNIYRWIPGWIIAVETHLSEKRHRHRGH